MSQNFFLNLWKNYKKIKNRNRKFSFLSNTIENVSMHIRVCTNIGVRIDKKVYKISRSTCK